jgi:hypothetical protein
VNGCRFIFQNTNGKLVERKDLSVLNKSNGWWCTVFPADIDSDGDMDYFLGNAGTNLQFKASGNEPIQMHAGDFNHDCVLDPVIIYFIKCQSYPLASRDELLDQISSLRKKFVKYEDYAKATILDIASDDQLNKSYVFNAFTLESCWLENLEGKDFRVKPLPAMAQLSSINGFVHDDFDGDGIKELLVAGNFFPFKPQLGRSDASNGLVLTYQQGDLKVKNGILSNVWLTGDIRDVAALQFNKAPKRLVVSRNDDSASIFSYKQQ